MQNLNMGGCDKNFFKNNTSINSPEFPAEFKKFPRIPAENSAPSREFPVALD